MLHEALDDYLEKIERAILQCGTAYVERYMSHRNGSIYGFVSASSPDDVIPARKPDIEQVVQEALSVQA